jgi:glycosyltransferase involved in cell wall biosynthesis
MSMAKPTVVGASGTNGFREQIIPDGEDQCGFHINPHNPDDIAWGVKQVLQMPDKGAELGKRARQRVIDEFSWDTVAKKTLDIYKEFL